MTILTEFDPISMAQTGDDLDERCMYQHYPGFCGPDFGFVAMD
jgi:hypothetical protein